MLLLVNKLDFQPSINEIYVVLKLEVFWDIQLCHRVSSFLAVKDYSAFMLRKKQSNKLSHTGNRVCYVDVCEEGDETV